MLVAQMKGSSVHAACGIVQNAAATTVRNTQPDHYNVYSLVGENKDCILNHALVPTRSERVTEESQRERGKDRRFRPQAVLWKPQCWSRSLASPSAGPGGLWSSHVWHGQQCTVLTEPWLPVSAAPHHPTPSTALFLLLLSPLSNPLRLLHFRLPSRLLLVLQNPLSFVLGESPCCLLISALLSATHNDNSSLRFLQTYRTPGPVSTHSSLLSLGV